MTTAISPVPEPAHSSPPRGQTYQAPLRSLSTRSRPQTAAALPHRAASTSHQHHGHHHNSSRPPSAGRALQEVLPHEEYTKEASNVVAHPNRSSSRDRPSSSSRPDPAKLHRRDSQRSSHSRTPSQSEMPSTAANNPGPAVVPHGAANPQPPPGTAAVRHGRTRTSIPSPSGKWILGKTIGAGSMGKVKLAKREDSNEQVACKIIPRQSPDDGHPGRAERERADHSKEIRAAREAAIGSLLVHPHVCGLRDVVRTNHHWYMLFEYVNGGQMLDYIISHGKLREKQARKFSRQIASALDYCHRNSVVHRDLKIENILISKNGDIKIIDFGLSNLFAPRGHLKTFCGSLYFAAPELLQARAYTGPEVDVWSFGIVLYVLVCGKVPFDDQSMPALHAKIKKGVVDYPGWLSTECKHLLSRMLVTDPKQRATMAEVMTHPWMLKGFGAPPDNHLPYREPLTLPLDQEVIAEMTGFNFGPADAIKAQLIRIIESEEYQRAVRLLQKERDLQQFPKESDKKRGFGFDFYKRRNSANSRDTLTAPSAEILQLGADPLNAFSPLVSIYYLVREKQERKRQENPASAVPPAPQKEREPVADIAPPKEAHTNPSTYEMPGEQATGGRTRPRARTHGEDEAPEQLRNAQAPSAAPQYQQDYHSDRASKKESTAAGLLRRFSTRARRKEPERLDKDRSHPPVVHVHSPSDAASLRKSFSIRRSRPSQIVVDDDPVPGLSPGLSTGSSQPQHRELLSPPLSARGNPQRNGLGRSTSVNSGELHRRRGDYGKELHPPLTSGSDQSGPATEKSSDRRAGTLSNRSSSMRSRTLGHARRESIQARRARREAESRGERVPEETDAELGEQSGLSTERLEREDPDLAKPVFLKGLFSVSTTSTKPVREIRADIKRVLRLLGADFTEIRGGFSCRHAPSIDMKRSSERPRSPQGQLSPQLPGHKRRFSFGGLRGGRSRDDVREREGASGRDHDRLPPTPRTSSKARERERDEGSSFNSDVSVESDPRESNGNSSRRIPAGETSTRVQDDLGGNMVLEFEIFVVKVPVISLHGIQFKRLGGNTWQYKNMADQILKELRL